MKNWFMIALLSLSYSLGFATPAVQPELSAMQQSYVNYLQQYPQTLGPIGNARLGEIEIITDPQKFAEIEQLTGRPVGIVAEDKYLIWMNDPVKFPNGKLGMYLRILWKQSLKGSPGVAVMAILPNNKIVLNRNYRHATRSWEYELPRGTIADKETIEAAAAREVKEETGMVIEKLQLLGKMAPDSGLTNSIIPIFLAKVKSQEQSTPEDSEAIAAIEAFSLEELKKGYIQGYLTAKIDGENKNIPLRDPFLSFALFQATIQGLVK
jgi:ADP-ribose pyrophosphatase